MAKWMLMILLAVMLAGGFLGLSEISASEPPRPVLIDDSDAWRDIVAAGINQPQEFSVAAIDLEQRTYGDITLYRAMGDWSDSQINVLILGDKFFTEADFLAVASKIPNQIFGAEPFSSNVGKFGVYVLSTKSTPSLSCRDSAMCDDAAIKAAIDNVANRFRFRIHEMIVVMNYSLILGKASTFGSFVPDSALTYAFVSSGSVDSFLPVILHEFAHSFGGLGDEYDIGSFRYEIGKLFINCLPVKDLVVEWAAIPGQPGTNFPGCNNTGNGFRDDAEDIMKRAAVGRFGPVDTYHLKDIIGQGVSRYVLDPLPPPLEFKYRIFLPMLSK